MYLDLIHNNLPWDPQRLKPIARKVRLVIWDQNARYMYVQRRYNFRQKFWGKYWREIKQQCEQSIILGRGVAGPLYYTCQRCGKSAFPSGWSPVDLRCNTQYSEGELICICNRLRWETSFRHGTQDVRRRMKWPLAMPHGLCQSSEWDSGS